MTAPERSRLSFAALGFGLAAALSSWNPLAAPVGLVVGVAALVLSAAALRRTRRRSIAAAALVVSIAAVAASAIVLALTAGVGRREIEVSPIVQSPERSDVQRELDQAGERTRAARERARRELEGLEPAQPTAPRDGGPRR